MAMSIMVSDLLLQAAFISSFIFSIIWMLNIPQSLFDKFRYREKPIYAAKRHFVLGAELLAKARSTRDRTAAATLATSAADHADKSIAINPTDAAAHILKGLALYFQGFTTSALEALDVALSPLTAKSLTDGDRSEALVKRAEIRMRTGKGDGGVEAAVADLVEAVRLKAENAAALRLLGECYEKKEMKEKAVEAYTAALKVEPESAVLQAALARLGSDSGSI